MDDILSRVYDHPGNSCVHYIVLLLAIALLASITIVTIITKIVSFSCIFIIMLPILLLFISSSGGAVVAVRTEYSSWPIRDLWGKNIKD